MFYLIHHSDIGPNDRDSSGNYKPECGHMEITTVPGRKNMSHEICTDGWLGSCNDNSSTAYGEYDTIEDARAEAADRGYTVEADYYDEDITVCDCDLTDDDGNDVECDCSADGTREIWYAPVDKMDQWDTDDYFYAVQSEITAEMSDVELADWVSKNETEAKNENANLHGDVEEWANKIRFEKRREKIESVLDDLDTVDGYRNESGDKYDPNYIVRFENGRIAYLSYNSDGKMQWRRSDLVSTGLSLVALGIAECNLYRKTKPVGGYNPRRRPIEPATAYDAARCDAVSKNNRTACRSAAVKQYREELKKDFLLHAGESIEKITAYKSTWEKISELERQIADLKKTLPESIPTIEYFSMATNSAACRLNNLGAGMDQKELEQIVCK